MTTEETAPKSDALVFGAHSPPPMKQTARDQQAAAVATANAIHFHNEQKNTPAPLSPIAVSNVDLPKAISALESTLAAYVEAFDTFAKASKEAIAELQAKLK